MPGSREATMADAAQALRDPGPEVVLTPRGFPQRAVRWGHGWQVGTAAYWVALTQIAVQDGRLPDSPARHRVGGNLAEEVAACLLGGHGLPHQTGRAAFEAVRGAGLLTGPTAPQAIEQVLRQPLRVGSRTVRYRFPAQRAAYLAAALTQLHAQTPPASARALRDWLLELPGIGPKTASWIVRNHLSSGEVAIIDIHILRAGIDASVFDPSWTPARHYDLLEALFLAWARHGSVSAADLDAIIWAERARRPGAYARRP
jgi:N-glycosylase/DNA lyase